MVWTLATLPPQIIGEILHSTYCSRLFLPLWFTGDRLLQAKLADGLRDVSLEGVEPHGARQTFVIPPLIANLRHLRSLSLNVARLHLKSGEEAQLLLTRLPQTLETLRLDIVDCHQPFLNYAAGPSTLVPASSRTPSGAPTSSRFFDLATLFPRLETLQIGNMFRSPTEPLNASELSVFPNSLTELQLLRLEFASSADFLALPRSLTNLQCRVHWHFVSPEQSANDWQSAPSALARVYAIEHMDSAGLAYLPKTICYESVNGLTGTWKKLASVPPLVDTVAITYVESADFPTSDGDTLSNWVATLPRGLLWLDLGFYNPTTFTPYIESLPRTVTHITIGNMYDGVTFMEWDVLEDLVERYGGADRVWPPTLTGLNITGQNMLPAHFKLLPRQSLQDLSVEMSISPDADSMDIQTSDFPPNLQSLVISDTLYYTPVNIEGAFPASLTFFAARGEYSVLNTDFLANFGPSLTDLECYLPIKDYKKMDFTLSPYLKTLSLTHFCYEWFGGIPSNVTELSLSNLGGASRIILDNPWPVDYDPFDKLPSGLKRLTIYEAEVKIKTRFFPPCSLKTLTSLTSLQISSKYRFPSKVIRNLPSTLRHLEIELNQLDEADAPFLPPHLISYQLGCDTE